ncbi:hypothetical protein BH11PSE5_BH11PSE5_13530 [soil metagenome]
MSSFEPFAIYWANYGGFKALAKSPYLWVAAAFTPLCYKYWLNIDMFEGRESAQLAIDIIPSLMAFSLGGMAILLAFSGGRFLNAIRQGGKPDSMFMELVANFFHFLLLQTIALGLAITVKSFPDSDWLAGVAFFFLAYSLTSALAASAMLLNISRIFNKAVERNDEP